MPINILMPALSPTMEKGNLAKWLVKEGDAVKSGQIMAEIETDKATMEFEAVDEGVIGRIAVPAGSEDVAVGTLIAVLLEEGESAGDMKSAAAPSPAVAAAPSPIEEQGKVAPAPSPSMGEGPRRGGEVDRIIASPLAKRLAQQAGIDLSAVKGSGPGGRIVKADLDAALGAVPGKPAPSAPLAQPVLEPLAVTAPQAPKPMVVAPGDIPHEDIKLSGMRKTIARRLTESKQQVPHIYLTLDCELDALLAVRKELNSKLEKQGVKLSVNDFVIRAVALSLKQVPACNVQFADPVMRQFTRVDVSVAVAIPGGLITPIIKDAGTKGLAAISSEMAALAEKAKAGKLQPDEYQGGTFSISNMGMMGIKDFCAVINPPQAGILAVGAGEQRAVVKNGALAIATVMSVTGSFDHRAIDGADGAAFLAAFKRLIEDPILMLA
jgi:pyruvate dehydrogenase E2 component (dihydrolipoamide acetyltransferase)